MKKYNQFTEARRLTRKERRGGTTPGRKPGKSISPEESFLFTALRTNCLKTDPEAQLQRFTFENLMLILAA